MFQYAEVYFWSKKTLYRIWYDNQIVGELIGVKLAKKATQLLNAGKVDEAKLLIMKSVKQSGLHRFLHQELVSNLERMKDEGKI